MASNKVFNVSDASFDNDVLRSQVPVLVDFTATWCGPCKQIAPYIDQIADEYDGRARVAKLDIDDNPASAARYGIRGVPTLLVFKDGKIVAQQVGAAPKKTIASLIDRALG